MTFINQLCTKDFIKGSTCDFNMNLLKNVIKGTN